MHTPSVIPARADVGTPPQGADTSVIRANPFPSPDPDFKDRRRATPRPTPTRADARTSADIDRLIADAFAPGRDPRSEQYRQGARAILDRRLCGASMPRSPYRLGTCEADAYFAGQTEGHFIARRVLGLEA